MRLSIYVAILVISCTTFSLSLVSLIKPTWIESHTTNEVIPLKTSWGLYQKCDTSYGVTSCRKFPAKTADCASVHTSSLVASAALQSRVEAATVEVPGKKKLGEDGETWGFCEGWETAGYTQQLALVFAAGAALGSVIMVLGGKLKRRRGWGVVIAMLSLHAGFQIITFGLVTHALHHSPSKFAAPGWVSHPGFAWRLNLASWLIDVLSVLFVLFARTFWDGWEEDSYTWLLDDEEEEFTDDEEEDDDETNGGPSVPVRRSA